MTNLKDLEVGLQYTTPVLEAGAARALLNEVVFDIFAAVVGRSRA